MKRRKIHKFLLACIAISVLAGSQLAFGKSVQAQFQAAVQAFDAKKYRRAQTLLRNLVKKYPEHRPSYFLLGRSEFFLGSYKNAAENFRRSGAEFVSDGANGGGFEYGMVFYSQKNYPEAIRGLKEVKAGVKVVEARLFLAMAYFYLGDHDQAERILNALSEPGQSLPQKYSDDKEKLRQAIEQKKMQGQWSRPFQLSAPPPASGQATGEMLRSPALAPPKAAPAVAKAPPPPPPKPAPPEPPFKASFTPRMSVEQKSQHADYQQTKSEDSLTQSFTFGVNVGLSYSLNPMAHGGRVKYTLGFDFASIEDKQQGKTIEIYGSDGEEGPALYAKHSETESNPSRGEWKLLPGVDVPFTKQVTGNINGFLRTVLPDLKQDNKTSSRGAGVALSFTGEKISLGSDASLTQSQNTDGETVREDLDFSASIGWPSSILAPKFRAALNLPSDPRGEILTGPNQTISIDADIKKSLPFGLTPGLGISTIFLDKFYSVVKKEDAEPDLYIASGRGLALRASLSVSPVDWLSGKMSYNRTKTDYTPTQEPELGQFQKMVPHLTTGFTLGMTLSKSF